MLCPTCKMDAMNDCPRARMAWNTARTACSKELTMLPSDLSGNVSTVDAIKCIDRVRDKRADSVCYGWCHGMCMIVRLECFAGLLFKSVQVLDVFGSTTRVIA